ncbi:MAG: cytochrome c biogenesis protein CcdA [Chloroflexota bacterium]
MTVQQHRMEVEALARAPHLRGLGIALMLALAIVLAGLWLPIALGSGDQLARVKFVRDENRNAVARVLTRTAAFPGVAGMDVLYATPEYFQLTGRSRQASRFAPDESIVFIISETIHEGQLVEPQPPVLRVGGRTVQPLEVTRLADSDHHRTTAVRFSRVEQGGAPLLTEDTSRVELTVSNPVGEGKKTLRWDLPIVYPESAEAGLGLAPGVILAMAAGLLAALSPCLIQQTAFYLSTLAGVGLANSTGAPSAAARRAIIKTALFFIVGFSLLYTGAGALAGLGGQTLQSFGALTTWTRPIAIGGGVVLVVMGLWVAVKAQAPLVCRMPGLRSAGQGQSGVRTMLGGFAFAAGCTTCFGGAWLAILLMYVGASGSVAQGALALFLFSMVIAVPYLLAAVAFSRVLPLVHHLERIVPWVGLVSAAVMIAFGVMMVSDQFHTVSGNVYSWMTMTF